MKAIWPIVAAGLIFWPLAAQAQGYNGVMAPQGGYRASTPAPAAPAAADPYGGTGASDATGYANMMNNSDTATQDYAQQDPPPTDDLGNPVKVKSSPFMDSFGPKASGDDEQGGVSIYDQVKDNGGTATERRRKAIIRKVENEQRKAAEEAKRVNAQRDRDIKATIKKSLRDAARKKHPGDTDDMDDTDDQDQDEDQYQDQDQDAGAANDSPDAVKE